MALQGSDCGSSLVWSSLAWYWLLSLSGVASWVLPPGVALIGVSPLILEL